MDKNSPSSPLLGDRYQLQLNLGTGGMAVVYQAWDLRLERPVAVKVLREDFSSSETFRERFRQEAKAAANLSHPNIVTVHDFGLDHERLYIVMEYVPGTDLKTMMKAHGAFSIDEAIPLMVQACAGIGYAHRAGFVHCDVKPHNLLVTPDQRLKVTDFGIARAMASIQPDEKYDIVWGSPQYFAPEQASGQAPMPASDVYSLGVILYEMLTGRLPFNSDDPGELARMHREVAPIPPRVFVPSIPPALEQILLKILSKEPAGRYRTADQMGRILLNFSQNADPYAANIPPLAQPVATIPSRAAPAAANQGSVSTSATSPNRRVVAPAHSFPNPPPQDPVETEAPFEVDWSTIGLALVALIAAGGLIPFWLYVWLTFNPPR
jgi:eukaryotic-like serine/threonine-protein kinase